MTRSSSNANMSRRISSSGPLYFHDGGKPNQVTCKPALVLQATVAADHKFVIRDVLFVVPVVNHKRVMHGVPTEKTRFAVAFSAIILIAGDYHHSLHFS